MKKFKLIFTIAATALVLSGCGLNMTKDAIITVNDKPITKQDYDKSFAEVSSNPTFVQLGVDLKNDKHSFLYLMLKDRVVGELIVKNLLDQEMDKRKIKVTNDDINKEMKNIVDKIGSKEKFEQVLKQNGVTAAQFKDDLSENIRVKKLVDSLSIVSVGDAQIEKYYKTNIDKFKQPDKVRASHILISANPDQLKQTILASTEGKKMTKEQVNAKVNEQVAAQYAKAQKLLAEVKKDPTKFAAVAKKNSDDPMSAAQGGDLGYFSAQEMVEGFSKVAFAMQPNTISDVVKTPYGYHIIYVTDRVKAGIEPLSKVKPEIKDYLESQQKVQILQKYIDTLKKNAKIVYKDPQYNPELIQKELKAQSQKNPAMKDTTAKKEKAAK